MHAVVVCDGHVHLHQTLRGVRKALEQKNTQKQKKQTQPKPARHLQGKTGCVLVTGICFNLALKLYTHPLRGNLGSGALSEAHRRVLSEARV